MYVHMPLLCTMYVCMGCLTPVQKLVTSGEMVGQAWVVLATAMQGALHTNWHVGIQDLTHTQHMKVLY